MTQPRVSPCVVLVVEDDPLVRLAAIDIVEDAHCRSYEASNADEAMALLEAHADINVLFTDIDMPRGSMNGLTLARAARVSWPGIFLIIASGHVRIAASDLPKGSVFFAKPYSAPEITGAIETAAARLQ